MFMPSRPDVEKNIKNRGITTQGRKGNTNAWPIETLTKGDVFVADGFGKIGGGTSIGYTEVMRYIVRPAMELFLKALPEILKDFRK